MAIEIVDLPIKNGGSFHSYVSLPEGKPSTYWDIPMETYGNHRFPKQATQASGRHAKLASPGAATQMVSLGLKLWISSYIYIYIVDVYIYI